MPDWNNQWDASVVDDLPLYELDRITGLHIRGDKDRVEAIVGTLRSVFREYEWDVPKRHNELIHECADQLTTTSSTAELMDDFATVAEAWGQDLDGFRAYASAYHQWTTTIGDRTYNTAVEAAGRALYLAYTEALRNLLAWVKDNQPEQEDDDDGEE